MQAVEAERTVHEIRGAFARTTNATEFEHIFRQHVHFVHRSNNLIRDRIVPTSLTEGCWVPAILALCHSTQTLMGGPPRHRKLRHYFVPFSAAPLFDATFSSEVSFTSPTA